MKFSLEIGYFNKLFRFPAVVPVAAATMTPFPLLAALAVKKLIEVIKARHGYNLADDALEKGEKHKDIWINKPQDLGESESSQKLMVKEHIEEANGCPVLPKI